MCGLAGQRSRRNRDGDTSFNRMRVSLEKAFKLLQ